MNVRKLGTAAVFALPALVVGTLLSPPATVRVGACDTDICFESWTGAEWGIDSEKREN